MGGITEAGSFLRFSSRALWQGFLPTRGQAAARSVGPPLDWWRARGSIRTLKQGQVKRMYLRHGLAGNGLQIANHPNS